jgi:uncharacterized protein YggE
MRNSAFSILALASASLAFGQLDTHTVTITATRAVSVQPDQSVFALYVNSPVNTSLGEVVSAIQGAGVGASDLLGVYTQTTYVQNQPQDSLQWAFTLAAPFAKISTTVSTLTQLQQSIAEKGLTLTYALQGIRVSPQLLESQQCTPSDLLADARAQAQKLVDATGFFLGPVLAVSSGNPGPVPSVPLAVGGSYAAVLAPGAVQAVALFLPPTPATTNCAITVKFGLN